MDKRLTRTDYLLTLLLILVLIIVVGAFFFGLKVGQDRTEAKYLAKEQQNRPAQALTAYHQQVLVSFYHTIYQPYRQFEKNWFDQTEAIRERNPAADGKSVLKQLKSSADDIYASTRSINMPDNSPLLVEAENNYLKSLKLFSEAIDRFQALSLPQGEQLLAQIDKDAYFQQAKSYALSAQKDYYRAILMWMESERPDTKNVAGWADKSGIPLASWNKLPLNVKNAYVASVMMKNGFFTDYYVQDATSRVDDLISSGKAGELKLDTADAVIKMLVAADAVRPGDFLTGKKRLYSGETLPELPFFYQP